MHVYADIVIGTLTLMVTVMGTINIARVFYLRSESLQLIIYGVILWLIRNLFMWCVLRLILTDGVLHEVVKRRAFSGLIYFGYVFIRELLNELRSPHKFYILNIFLVIGRCIYPCLIGLSGYSVINLLDRENIINSSKNHVFAIFVLCTACGLISRVLEGSDFDGEIKAVLPEGEVKKTLIDVLDKTVPFSYEIVTVNNEKMDCDLVYVETTGLVTLLILSPTVIKMYSLLELQILTTHHVLEHTFKYKSLFRSIVKIFEWSLVLIKFILVFGHLSKKSPLLRIIMCFELSEINTQIKVILFSVPSYRIERSIVKKIKDYVNLPKKLPSEKIEKLIKRVKRQSFSRHFSTKKYDYILYQYTDVEWVQDIGIKTESSSS
ncbi:hypothetical protein NEIG_01485 [Nematocida sp. ERTm5]|nr:hypothetical protein NEIG_01485 [Nematocida sp. ERTm5]